MMYIVIIILPILGLIVSSIFGRNIGVEVAQAISHCLSYLVDATQKFTWGVFEKISEYFTLHNICRSMISKICLCFLIFILVNLPGLEKRVSYIFLICFIWGIYLSFIKSKNWNEFFTNIIVNRVINIINNLIFNTLFLIFIYIVYSLWDISSFDILAFWLYMNTEMPSGEGSGTSSGGASGGMPPWNNPGGNMPPGHDPGNHGGIVTTSNNANENDQDNNLDILFDPVLLAGHKSVIDDLIRINDLYRSRDRTLLDTKASKVVNAKNTNTVKCSDLLHWNNSYGTDHLRVRVAIRDISLVLARTSTNPDEYRKWSNVAKAPLALNINKKNLDDLRGCQGIRADLFL